MRLDFEEAATQASHRVAAFLFTALGALAGLGTTYLLLRGIVDSGTVKRVGETIGGICGGGCGHAYESWRDERKMRLGTVRRFVDEKGRGLISPDGGGPLVRFHRSAVTNSEASTVPEGLAVRYRAVVQESGPPLAVKVELLYEPDRVP